MLQRVGNIENCMEAKDKGNCEKPLLWSRERGWRGGGGWKLSGEWKGKEEGYGKQSQGRLTGHRDRGRGEWR